MSFRLFLILSALLFASCASDEDGPQGAGQSTDAGVSDQSNSLRDLPANVDLNDDQNGEPAADQDAGTDSSSSDAATPDTGSGSTDISVEPETTPVYDATETTSDADPCAGLTPCSPTQAGSRCEGEVVVFCEQSYDGCWFETRQDCSTFGDECVTAGANAYCSAPSLGGDSCTDAIVLTPGTSSFDTTSFANTYEDYEGDCSLTFGWGSDIVFAIEVPAGQTMRATLTPESSFDIVAVISSACPDIINSCLVTADDGFTGDAEVVSVVNNGAGANTAYVIAEGWSSSQAGHFSILVEFY